MYHFTTQPKKFTAPQTISPGGYLGLEILKKYDIGTKTHSPGSVSALEVRNLSQWYQKTIPMLRLIPQLLRSSEIQLFEGQAPPFKGFPLYSLRNPYYILTWPSKDIVRIS